MLNVNEVLPLCHSLASCGILGLGNITRVGASAIAPTARLNFDLTQPVWLVTAEEDLKRATQELQFFRQILEAPSS